MGGRLLLHGLALKQLLELYLGIWLPRNQEEEEDKEKRQTTTPAAAAAQNLNSFFLFN
jgi:hypothetical protein